MYHQETVVLSLTKQAIPVLEGQFIAESEQPGTILHRENRESSQEILCCRLPFMALFFFLKLLGDCVCLVVS